ncbi:MAG TPA: hypothetical protein VGE79_04705, partial [Niastella sp.]
VSIGQNCSTCSRPAKWTTIAGTVQCETVNGINTGIQLQQEQDTASCSSTSGQTRWVVIGQNCTACARPAKWTATGNLRCVTDGSDNNTGYQERQETDTASCSGTTGQTRWVLIGQNCTACSRPAKWRPDFVYRCAKDGNGNNTGYQEQQQTDTASCSSTSGQTRWVNIGLNCSTCASQPANWVPTNVYRCQTAHHPPYPLTGYLERKEINTATCSGEDSVRWVTTTLDCNACAGGTNCPTCDVSSCNGVNKKCINGNCETGVLICFSSQWDTSMGEYLNYYRYEFSDGSSSGTYWNYEPYPCALP